jgi:crossover junction endodeoxyribonuclease RusA
MIAIEGIHTFTINLSWPASPLMQNRHDGRHWSFAADEKAMYRREAYLLALSAINTSAFEPDERQRYRVTMVFHPPDARRRDVSNLHAAMKSAIDGIAAAMGVDDSMFTEHSQRASYAIGRGRVVVTVEEI